MGLLLTNSVLFALELDEVQLVKRNDHRQARHASVAIVCDYECIVEFVEGTAQNHVSEASLTE